MEDPKNISQIIAFICQISVAVLMIATYIHISVSLNMLGSQITLKKANVIKRTAYATTFLLWLLFTISEVLVMTLENDNRAYIVQMAVITAVLAFIFTITLFTFMRSMNTLTFQSEYMMTSLQDERKSVIINCLMFICGYIIISVVSIVVLEQQINNINNIEFLKNIFSIPGFLMPVLYMIYTHYKVFSNRV